MDDNRSTQLENPYAAPMSGASDENVPRAKVRADPEPSSMWVVLVIALAGAWFAGMVAGSMIWHLLYPNEKDPQLLLSWTRYAGLAIGVMLYVFFHNRLRLARPMSSVVALLVAVVLGFISSLAGICWAVCIRTQ